MTISPILIFHIGAGALGLLSGAAAMSFRKSSRLHRSAGNGFFISMLCMSASAVYLAFTKSLMISILGGSLTFYLVATAWMAVRRNARETGLFEAVALLGALAISAGYFIFGLEAANSETGLKDGLPAAPYYFFGAVAAFGAGLDLRMILHGGISGAQRIARHLWRMCFAMFMAIAALILGQQELIPESIRVTQIHLVPIVMVILLMFFWLCRVLFTNRYRKIFMYARLADKEESI